MDRKEAKITEELSDFVAGSQYDDFPAEARLIAKRCVIDGVGVILAGSTEPCTRIMRDYVLAAGGKRESSILGKGKVKVPAHLAALVNATAGHAMDWDDTALSTTPDKAVLLHPTGPALAAGLAIGEHLGLGGRDLLTGFLVGFEVECKIAEAMHSDHFYRGFHSSGTLAILGATSMAAKLMGLPSKQVRNALGISTSMAAGLSVNHGTMTKPLHAGRSAENGIVSAQLAALGYEAHPEAFEAPKGFFRTFGGEFDPDKICGKLGRPFSILDPGVSIKPYPCGVVGHPAMDAMQALALEHDIRPEEVESIKVATGSNVLPPLGPLRYRKAKTALEGKFSVPFQMASMVVRRKAGMLEFTDEFVQSPAVQDMMDRVETVIDPEIDALGRHRIVSLIEVRMKDGRVLKGRSAEHYRGGPRNPLTRESLAEKFNDCVQNILNRDQAKTLLKKIESLERVGNLRTLTGKAVIP